MVLVAARAPAAAIAAEAPAAETCEECTLVISLNVTLNPKPKNYGDCKYESKYSYNYFYCGYIAMNSI